MQEFKIGQRVKFNWSYADQLYKARSGHGEGAIVGRGVEGVYYIVALDQPLETDDVDNGTTALCLAFYGLEVV